MDDRQNLTAAALRAAAFLCLMTSVLIAPWLFGGVQYWAQLASLSAAIFACGLAIAFSLTSSPGNSFPKAGWVAVAILFLALFQLVKLSPATLELLSPGAAELRAEFGQSPEMSNPISLHPAVTRSVIGVLVLGVVIFAVAHRAIATWMVRWALLMITVNGAVLVVEAIWQRQYGDNLLYGMVESTQTAIGPFVNRNNAAGYLLACMAASIGVVSLSIVRIRSRARSHYTGLREYLHPLENPIGAIGIFCGILIAAGIVLSQSRGGCLALGVAAVSTLGIVLQQNHLKIAAFTIGLVAACSITLLVYFEEWNPASLRIATVTDESVLAEDGRLELWSNSLGIIGDYWLTGTGVGTFRDVYPLYNPNANRTVYTHAENEFVQAACVAGVPGLLLVLTTIGCIGLTVFKLLIRADGFARTLGAVGLFFLISQIVANSFDFGFSIPANLVVCALLAGIVTGVGFRLETVAKDETGDTGPVELQDSRGAESEAGARLKDSAVPTKTTRPKSTPASGERQGWPVSVLDLISGRQMEVILLGLGCFALFSAVDLARASSVETLPSEYRPTVTSKQQSFVDAKTIAFNRQGERLLRNIHTRWDDAKAHAALAEWYIYRYEQQVATQWPSESNRIVPVARLAGAVERFRSEPRLQTAATRLVDLDPVRQNLKPALKHLLAARDACCLLPNVHLRLAHLAFLESDDRQRNTEQQAADFGRVVRLLEGGRYDQFAAGVEYYAQGNYDQAFATWKPCLEVNSRYTGEIVARATQVAPLSELYDVLLPTSDEFLIELANKHLASPSQRAQRKEVLAMLSARRGN